MFVVDASVWVSRFLPGDENHQMSREWLHDVLRQRVPIVGPSLFMAEVTGALSRRLLGSELGLNALRDITLLRRRRLVSLAPHPALLTARMAAELRLRGADSTYLSLARRLGFTLVTWDRELRERGAAVADVKRPSELLRDPR